MTVKKFGGSSQKIPELLKNIKDIVTNEKGNVIVVLSAKGKTTTKLLEIYNSRNEERSKDLITKLEKDFLEYVHSLIDNKEILLKLKLYINNVFKDLIINLNKYSEKKILSIGELLSTQIFHNYLKSVNISSNLLPSLNFMIKNKKGEINIDKIKELLNTEMNKLNSKILITEGFICRNFKGEIDNLEFEGGDYTATIISSLLDDCSKVEIWTDVDGIYDKDPNKNSDAKKIEHLTFEDAEKMALAGVKVLHPKSIKPLKNKDIDLYIKNTLNPSNKGTLINNR